MDADRFDTLARSLSVPRSRRAALSSAAAGGLLSALGLTRPVPEIHAAQGGTCVVAFAAEVLQGPSSGQALTPNGGRAGEVRGTLSFSLSRSGSLDNAALTLPDGTSLPVVGDATGHSLQLRIALGPQRGLVAVGVGEQEITRCQGAIDGVVSGPQSGDLGDWHATAGVQNVPSDGQGSAKPAKRKAAGTAGASGGAGSGRSGRAGRSDRGATAAAGAAGDAGNAGQGNAAGTGHDRSCPSGETYCAYVEECRDLRTSPLDCGACGTRCPSLVCQDSRCLSEEGADSRGSTGLECDPNETICDGVCAYLPTDPRHCGACGNECNFNIESCQNGVCVVRPDEADQVCPAGQTRCGDTCVDTTSDADNCGACGTLCPVVPETYNCEGGVCVPPSCAPLTNCGGLCDDLLTSSLNCGACGIVCAEGTTCQFGTCTTTTEAPPPLTCGDQGLIECFGVCVDLQTDPSNCGFCGEVCPSGQCATGICIELVGPAPSLTCEAGLTDCFGTCVDLMGDPNNCSACGSVCPDGPEGRACQSGVCVQLGSSG